MKPFCLVVRRVCSFPLFWLILFIVSLKAPFQKKIPLAWHARGIGLQAIDTYVTNVLRMSLPAQMTASNQSAPFGLCPSPRPMLKMLYFSWTQIGSKMKLLWLEILKGLLQRKAKWASFSNLSQIGHTVWQIAVWRFCILLFLQLMDKVNRQHIMLIWYLICT